MCLVTLIVENYALLTQTNARFTFYTNLIYLPTHRTLFNHFFPSIGTLLFRTNSGTERKFCLFYHYGFILYVYVLFQ